jgi:serine protease Do
VQKVIKNLVVIGIISLILSGCGGVTALSALSTVGSAAASRVIEHKAGYGIQSPHTIIDRVMPSVVTIISETNVTSINSSSPRGFFKPGEVIVPAPNNNAFQSGTGFVIEENGTVITNYHVIANIIEKSNVKLRVLFSDDSIYEAKIFNYDKTSDIAVLKIVNDENKKFTAITWGDKPKLGGHAIIIGSPIGLDFSVSFGIVSAVDRVIPKASPPFVPYVQTDASMNRGNSGGPLFDANGEVIGINTLILTPSSGTDTGSVGLGFAIDGQYAQEIIKRLLDSSGKIKWSYMGINYRLLDMEETKRNNLKFGSSVIIVKVEDNGSAYGVLKENDIVQKMNGSVITHKTFASMVARLAPGTKIVLTLLRDGKLIDIDLVLTERPE